MANNQGTPANLNLNVRGLRKSATLAINERSRELASQGKDIYYLGFGQSPFPVPEPVAQALRDNAHQKDYLPVKGLYPLREAIAAYWKRVQGLEYTAEDIMISPGSKELLFILQLVYYGDLVIPSPSWVSYSPQATIIGKRVHWVKTLPENDWKLTPEELENLCKSDPNRPRIIILNYPSNPTGATYSTEQLQQIAEIARKYNAILISDEIYGELDHNGEHVSIARYYPEGTIISSGLSKWCGAGGWRMGMFTFPSELRWLQNACAVVASETYTSTSAPVQYAAITAYQEHPVIEEQLIQSRRILKAAGNYLYNRLQSMGVSMPKPEGGFYLFPNFSKYKAALTQMGIHNSGEFCERLLSDTGVALLPSFDFGRPSDELTARLSYVDFDGEAALELAKNEYADKALDQAFLERCCPRMIEAANRMEEWIKNIQ
ncbi:MAG: aminotransferase class I/II-fold pyridoxal phosphate-dependent enzyme [Chitinophagales bacterium]|nr:aminotransferase class I/II-fold pyridoxal phosphate-dependent enzyme [Chitinophagales bacterium]